MATINLESITSALTVLDESGVSVEGKANKWEDAKAVEDLIRVINECSNLTYLNLEGNTLGVKAAECIGEALKKHPELKRALWKDLFTGRLKNEIPLALKSMGSGITLSGAQLSVLDCSDNALGPNGMIGLVDLIKSTACYALQELKLNNCGLGIDGGRMLAKALLECYKNSSKSGNPLALRVFIAGRNRLENNGAIALTEVFQTLQSLEEIAMPQNGIYHLGISALSEALMVNENMQILNLNDNTIGPKGSVALMAAIEKMQNLREINFGDCLLKTNGAVSIGAALNDGNLELEVLNLEYNEIGSRGGRVISAAMDNKCKLKSLLLNGNKFGAKFREELMEDLKAIDRLNVLGKLSDDESDASDDDEEEEDAESEEDEEDDDEYGEEEEEEDDYDEETEGRFSEVSSTTYNSTLDNTLDSNITFVASHTLPQTLVSFMTVPHPTESLFNNLEEKDKVAAFRDFLANIPQTSYLIQTIFTILKLASISESCAEALEVSSALFKDIFEFAQKTNQSAQVRNFFLVQLGLIKAEEKNIRLFYDTKACRYALQNAISKNSIPEEQKTIFELFLAQF